MMKLALLAVSLLSAQTCLAAPAPAPALTRRAGCITAEQIIAVAPNSAACNATADFAEECRTAEQAAPFINAAFEAYGTRSIGEEAALLSLMTFETGGFRFDRNHFPPPGRPGQGTRNLMMFPFVLQYALDTPSVAAQAAELMAPFAGVDPNDVPDDTKNAVRELVLPDDLSFASASWFLVRSGECGEDIRAGLQEATEVGWDNYITNCIGTEVTEDRRTEYLAALAALSN